VSMTVVIITPGSELNRFKTSTYHFLKYNLYLGQKSSYLIIVVFDKEVLVSVQQGGFVLILTNISCMTKNGI
jgi:hypothetical protein